MKPKRLKWFLSDLQTFQRSKLSLEQYATSPELAVAILDLVNDDGCLEDCTLADLGCGCGVLMLGAATYGTSYCLGLEIDDDALNICRQNIVNTQLEETVDVVKIDVTKNIQAIGMTRFDTVITNPPFGTKNNSGIDIQFVLAGLSLLREGGCLYSLHKSSTKNFILKTAKKWNNVEASCIAELNWDLPATYKHHKMPSFDIAVCLSDAFASMSEKCREFELMKVPKLVAAPMVRYSKLPFRLLVRQYSADIVFSPMIYAKNFIASEQCRNNEFTTCKDDESTIIQFASDNPDEFSLATMFVYKFTSGVNLNCGCPKRDVIKDGYGSCLLTKPDLIADIISYTRRRIPDLDYSISIKIRIEEDLKSTVELCRRAEKAGATFLTVHGRTVNQRSQKPNYEAIKLVKSILKIPVIANGGVKTYSELLDVAKFTNADGVMVGNGLLENPALFAGYDYTPVQCVKDWVTLTAEHGLTYDLFHQQLIFMLRKVLSSNQRKIFNNLLSRPAVCDFLEECVY
uniref:MTS domain-containing protein n=1 Tax=Syphacia muris TaxID=451379 RepID=A0A0N5AJ46_9BILA